MPAFFSTSYDSEDSSDEELLLSTDDEREQQKQFIASNDSSDEDEELIEESESDEDEVNEASDHDHDHDDDEYDSEEWDDDSESESESDDDVETKGRSYFLKKDFLKGLPSGDSDSDSDSEDEKKVVKSAKEKYLDEIATLVDQIENYSMVEDWIKIATELDKLYKLFAKYSQYHIAIPRLYIKSLAILEDSINNFNEKDSKKRLNASESKSFNIIKQKVKKYIKENQSEVDLYRKDPDAYENGNIDENSNEITANEKSNKSLKDDVSNIFFVLQSVIETRGKKNVDQNEQVEILESLVSSATKPFELISIYLLLISVRYDLYSKSVYMPLDQWKIALSDVSNLLTVLEQNKNYIVTEIAVPTDDISIEPESDSEGVKKIVGSIASFVERLSDELTSHLLVIDPHSTEYIERLKDESVLYNLLVRSQIYYERIIPTDQITGLEATQLSRVILKRLETIYYKPCKLIILSEINAWKSIDAKEDSVITPRLNESNELQNVLYTNNLIDSLCSVLYKQSNSIFRKKAVMCHIYYYAFNDQFYKARDMMLLSHLQATIHTADSQLQVLFNRSLVQLGLSAFRKGLIDETQQLLQEIATSPRQKELLGQGVQRFQLQQSQIDKQRLLPFHMHINLELLECSFYTASLLIEIPQMAQNPELMKKRQNSSKSFKRVLEYHEKQYFDGPPEDTRDHIMLAARQLSNFNWEKSYELLNSIKIWDLFSNAEALKKSFIEKLQIASLKTYIFTNRKHFSKCSIDKLNRLFKLDEDKIKSILSKMIFNEEVSAFLNIESNVIQFIDDENKPNKLQELIVGLSDKCNSIIERNEKLSLGGYQIQMDPKKQQNKSNQNRK